MEDFPPEFTYAKLLADVNSMSEARKAEMAALRKSAHDTIVKAMADGCTDVMLNLKEYSRLSRQQLIRELCERFPGRVMYHAWSFMQDIDRMEVIKDEKNPPDSHDYQVKLD